MIKSPVEELSKALGKASVDSISLKLALQEHYETYYGIYNHDGQYVPPLSIVTMHPKERYDPYGRYRRIVKNFTHYDIGVLYGYNLSEFLDLPRAKVDLLMEEAAERKRKKDQREDRLAKLAKRAQDGSVIHDS